MPDDQPRSGSALRTAQAISEQIGRHISMRAMMAAMSRRALWRIGAVCPRHPLRPHLTADRLDFLAGAVLHVLYLS
jgi:hypothetical protein